MISGFQASNIGQYGIEDFSWSQGGRIGSYTTTVAPGPGGVIPGAGTSSPFFENSILDALGQIVATWAGTALNASRTSLPELRPQDVWQQASVPVDADPESEAVVPQAEEEGTLVLNPDLRPDFTVYENAPGGIYEVERAPTDWDAYYRRYEELNRPEEEEPVFDWLQGATTLGQLGSAVGWWGGDAAATAAPAVQPGPQPVPARVTVDTRTGKITACKRRRRRKLLTESDFNVLLRVATLPNKENVRIVLGKAIGRG